MAEIIDRKTGQNNPIIAMVALHGTRLPSAGELQSALEEQFPELPHSIRVGTLDKTSLEALTVGLPNAEGIAALMPAPIPWEELEGPCSTALWWPEATEELRAHKAHVIISLLGPTSDVIADCLLVTKLAAGVAAASKCAGVYWGSGALVRSPEYFIETSKHARPDELPLNCWIDFRVESAPGGGEMHQLLTTGLEALNKMEIEIAPCRLGPMELLDLGYNAAHYVLTSNAVLQDGHTIGHSTVERIKIRIAKSMWARAGRVMRLEVPSPAALL